MKISARAQKVPASPIRKLTPLADAAKKRGVRVLHLNIGQPDLPTPEALRARVKRDMPDVLAYSPSGGTADYVASLVSFYRRSGLDVKPEHVLATTGGSEALVFALMAVGDPGDEVLIPEPFYTNYAAFAAMAGLTVKPLTLRAEDGFHLPSREVWEAACTPKTRAVIACNPNNPTGTVYHRSEIEELAAFCKAHDLALISDEVYRDLVYDGREATSALSLDGMADRTIVVDSLSKRYSACGIRLGCLITKNPEIMAACLCMAQARLSPPGLAQLAALGADDLGPPYFQGVVSEYTRRRDVLYEGLSAIPGVSLHKPEGAFYTVVTLPVDDAEAFARYLLTDFSEGGETVMVAPAEGFYATPGLGKNQARIAYVLAEADLKRAIALLGAALGKYKASAA